MMVLPSLFHTTTHYNTYTAHASQTRNRPKKHSPVRKDFIEEDHSYYTCSTAPISYLT